MQWTPPDVIRICALIGGFLLLILSALMMWHGINAEGAIDIKTSILSGSIKTGSAGLFLAFFAFAIIVYAIATAGLRGGAESAVTRDASHKKSKRMLPVLGALFLGTVGSAVAAAYVNVGFVFLSGFLGVGMLVAGIAYVEILERE